MFRTLSLAAALMLAAVLPGFADADRAAVEAFYEDLLSNPKGDDLGKRVRNVITEDWVSIPTPRGGPGAEGMTKTLAGFGKTIPDLNWEIQEVMKIDNRYVVRSFATGTPVKEVFGVQPKGNTFRIMTIDIHKVKDGKIVESYHVEDWYRAKRQLASE